MRPEKVPSPVPRDKWPTVRRELLRRLRVPLPVRLETESGMAGLCSTMAGALMTRGEEGLSWPVEVTRRRPALAVVVPVWERMEERVRVPGPIFVSEPGPETGPA